MSESTLEKPATSTTLLETGGLSVRYGGVSANSDIDISVSAGEIVGLIGPNGAGKTTFVDAVTGFTKATGTVSLRGERLDKASPHRRRRAGMARTWQAGELFTDLTVEQNLAVANDAILPSYRLDAKVAGAVWWIDPGERAHIRWVRREDEKPLLDALARVHAADNLSLGEGTKFAGVFRTDGLLVPVWDLDNTKPHDHWIAAVEEADKRIAEALASEEPLTAEERKSRETIVSRQVTIRN